MTNQDIRLWLKVHLDQFGRAQQADWLYLPDEGEPTFSHQSEERFFNDLLELLRVNRERT